jgi:hypothetical protein
MRVTSRYSMIVAAAALLGTGCAGTGLGQIGDILAGAAGMPTGATQGQVSAEVRTVNTQQRLIEVRTQDGQTGNVQYDQNTVVVYNQQQYQVTALERGDLVVLHVQQDAAGNVYVSRIDVTQSVRDRPGAGTGTGALQQLSGRVGQIDYDRGFFTMAVTGGTVTISLPYNAPQATVDYFRRLRAGDSVRLEGTVIGTNRVEIYRFL